MSQGTRHRRSAKRRVLHPERILDLLGRAGWPAQLAAVGCLLLTALGLWLIAAPFTVDYAVTEPVPQSVQLGCPPSAVGAFAGRGGISTPELAAGDAAAVHDRSCAVAARNRLVTGVLLVIAGLLNTAAILEWSRVRRRKRRRQHREARRDAAPDEDLRL